MERDADLPARADPVDALILDLLEWLDRAPRPYADVMEAWRTSCPRLPVRDISTTLTRRGTAGNARPFGPQR